MGSLLPAHAKIKPSDKEHNQMSAKLQFSLRVFPFFSSLLDRCYSAWWSFIESRSWGGCHIAWPGVPSPALGRNPATDPWSAEIPVGHRWTHNAISFHLCPIYSELSSVLGIWGCLPHFSQGRIPVFLEVMSVFSGALKWGRGDIFFQHLNFISSD